MTLLNYWSSYSKDTFFIAALNVLSLISWDAPNEVFLEQIRKEVWQHLFQLLLLPDIQLVLLSLDTLYQFTCHGSPHAASALLQVHRLDYYYTERGGGVKEGEVSTGDSSSRRRRKEEEKVERSGEEGREGDRLLQTW